uniref:TIGR04283 family arsenosugar biosynthesis glycosyltransferase n=1 Tax=Mariniflexile sp. TaxID=1979402 RepID=UPI004047F3F9
MTHKIGIIIPILNEAFTIGHLLNHVLKNTSKENISEIIVVDGGSTDGSLEIIESLAFGSEQLKFGTFNDITANKIGLDCARPDILLLNSEKGRAKQMNFGAKHATGNILYFLHADSFPPKNFDKLITEEVKKGHKAGCFIMKFDSNHWWLKLAGWLTQLHWKACRGGDQSLFITKPTFNKIGGYNENHTIYEDNDLIAKLYKLQQFTVIQKWLTTSARRYHANGVWKLQFHFTVIYIKKRFGASADDLFAYYKKHIC